jgi:multidrug resistance efflux pump
VQRIPVKIALDSGASIELRPGMSVIPSIETKARAVAKTNDKTNEKAPATSKIALAAQR